MGALEKIYSGDYDPSKAGENLPFSLRLQERAFWDAVEEGMGADFIKRHWDGLCKLEQYKGCANFREGFRLGVSLMMELM